MGGTKNTKRLPVLFCTLTLIWMCAALIRPQPAAAGISLSPNPGSGAPVGSTITWTASNSSTGPNSFRFTVQRPDGAKVITRDFDIYNSFQWTPLEEGSYKISVTLRDANGRLTDAARQFVVTSRVAGQNAVVTSTQHPLVALYSAPCSAPTASVRVQFRPVGENNWQATPYKSCFNSGSVNFLVVGMRPQTTYQMRHEVAAGPFSKDSNALLFTTGTSEIPAWKFQVTHQPADSASLSDGVILHSILFGGEGRDFGLGCPVATDLAGNVIWYYKEPLDLQEAQSFMMSFPPSVGGTFLIQMSRPPIPDLIPGPVRGQLFREIDLAGNTIRETNVDRVNEQLAAMGFDPIYYFHHDARRLPNGHTLALAGLEKILTDVQGDGPVDVVGDMVIDLDENLQVVWAWSTFGHDGLPVARRAHRDEVCAGTPNVCGPLRLSPAQVPVAHDWTHANTVTYTPADGNIILSFRHQDWIIKVDYANGKGSGKILWRLGNQGDFTIRQPTPSSDPNPWFSGQHQAMLYGQNELVVFDNSNARVEAGLNADSRGQVYRLDEHAKIANLVVNADLGVYASYLGSAQKLSNGNYHFLAGGIAGSQPSPVPGFPAGLSESIEVDPAGNILFTLQAPYHTTYRSFRLKSMYQPADIPGDADGDGDVDLKDLAMITSKLGQHALVYDPNDVDGNGIINFNDLREAAALCTLPLCKQLNSWSPVTGY
jgi:arylsulfate sulfotransferase